MKGNRLEAGHADTLVVELLDDGMPADSDVDLGGRDTTAGWRSFWVLAAVLAVALAVILGMTVFGRDERATGRAVHGVPHHCAGSLDDGVRRLAPAPARPRRQGRRATGWRPSRSSRTSHCPCTCARSTAQRSTRSTSRRAGPLRGGHGRPRRQGAARQEPRHRRPAAIRTGSCVGLRPSGAVWLPSAAGSSLELVQIADGQEVLIDGHHRSAGASSGPRPSVTRSSVDPMPGSTSPPHGGQRTKIADGLVSFVEGGNFVGARCDESQQCVIVALARPVIRRCGFPTTGAAPILLARWRPARPARRRRLAGDRHGVGRRCRRWPGRCSRRRASIPQPRCRGHLTVDTSCSPPPTAG